MTWADIYIRYMRKYHGGALFGNEDEHLEEIEDQLIAEAFIPEYSEHSEEITR